MVKRVELSYKAATTHTPSVDKIVIPSSHIEELDRVIKAKVEQNERMRIASYEEMKNLIVK